MADPFESESVGLAGDTNVFWSDKPNQVVSAPYIDRIRFLRLLNAVYGVSGDPDPHFRVEASRKPLSHVKKLTLCY